MNKYETIDLPLFYEIPNYSENITCHGVILDNRDGHAKGLIFTGQKDGKVTSCHAVSIAWLKEIIKMAEENGE